MPAKINFKKSVLSHSVHLHFDRYHINKLICSSVFLSVFAIPVSYSDQIQSNQNLPSSSETISTSSEKISNTQEQLESAAIQQGVPNEKIDQLDQKIQQTQQTQAQQTQTQQTQQIKRK